MPHFARAVATPASCQYSQPPRAISRQQASKDWHRIRGDCSTCRIPGRDCRRSRTLSVAGCCDRRGYRNSAYFPGVAADGRRHDGAPQLLINRQLGVVGGDQSQLQAAAQLADTQSQMAERDAQGRNFDARANYYNPEPMSAGQAQSLGHPEWEGLKLDARDAERLVGGAAHNQTTLQTHFGGQQRNLSAEDAAAIRTPSLEGASMSNDEYQRLLQGAQHNQQSDTNNQRTTAQSDVNNRRTNSTRITTTGMRDDTSEDNSNRAHPGGGQRSQSLPAFAIGSKARRTRLSTKRGRLSTTANPRWMTTWTIGSRRRMIMRTGCPRKPAARFLIPTFAATWMRRATGPGTEQRLSRSSETARLRYPEGK